MIKTKYSGFVGVTTLAILHVLFNFDHSGDKWIYKPKFEVVTLNCLQIWAWKTSTPHKNLKHSEVHPVEHYNTFQSTLKAK